MILELANSLKDELERSKLPAHSSPPHLLLVGSSQLQQLVLGGNQLGSCDLCQLAALPSLRSLDLSHNNLTRWGSLLSPPLSQCK